MSIFDSNKKSSNSPNSPNNLDHPIGDPKNGPSEVSGSEKEGVGENIEFRFNENSLISTFSSPTSVASSPTPILSSPSFLGDRSISRGDPPRKTSNRLYYEAQVDVIKKQIGSLEEVRTKLNLSSRKMAQLLLVDPSAWTRWTGTKYQQKGVDAPPSIYRALQWYLTLQEKIPGLTPYYFIGKDPEIYQAETLKRVNEKVDRGVEAGLGKISKELSLEMSFRIDEMRKDNEQLLGRNQHLQSRMVELETRLAKIRNLIAYLLLLALGFLVVSGLWTRELWRW